MHYFQKQHYFKILGFDFPSRQFIFNALSYGSK